MSLGSNRQTKGRPAPRLARGHRTRRRLRPCAPSRKARRESYRDRCTRPRRRSSHATQKAPRPRTSRAARRMGSPRSARPPRSRFKAPHSVGNVGGRGAQLLVIQASGASHPLQFKPHSSHRSTRSKKTPTRRPQARSKSGSPNTHPSSLIHFDRPASIPRRGRRIRCR